MEAFEKHHGTIIQSDVCGTYGFECGGRTEAILTLNNEDISRYHQQYYQLKNLTVILSGEDLKGANLETLLTRLSEEPCIKDAKQVNAPEISPIIESPIVDRYPFVSSDFLREEYTDLDGRQFIRQIHFPSSDVDLGSVTFAWLGPVSNDLETVMALDVLLRFMQETSASPLYQCFVERSNPLADDIDFEFKLSVNTMMLLTFSGVPFAEVHRGNDDETSGDDDKDSDGEDEHEGEDDSEEDDASDDSSEANSGPEITPPSDPNLDLSSYESIITTYTKLLWTVMDTLFLDEQATLRNMRRTIHRNLIRFQEGFEDDPHSVASAFIIPDVLLHHYNGTLTKDAPLGVRFQIPAIMEALRNKPVSFWRDLLDRYILQAPFSTVFMIPDKDLSKSLEEKEQAETAARVEKLGPKGLEQLAQEVKSAMVDNKVNITDGMIQRMPAIPPADSLPKLSCQMRVHSLPEDLPFVSLQQVNTETAFQFIRLCFYSHMVPVELRPYMVLFQEMLFQSPLRIRDVRLLNELKRKAMDAGYVEEKEQTGKDRQLLDYRALVKAMAMDVVHSESTIGLGYDTFSCSWLSNVFLLLGQCSRDRMEGSVAPLPETVQVPTEYHSFGRLVSWILLVLFQSEFTAERMETIVKTLLSGITEMKRDGGEIVSSAMVRSTSSSCALMNAGLQSVPADKADNDMIMSMFVQEKVLKQVLRELKNGQVEKVVGKLNALRVQLVQSVFPSSFTNGGFIQMCTGQADSSKQDILTDIVVNLWRHFLAEFQKRQNGSTPSLAGKKRSRGNQVIRPPAFPFHRIPFFLPKTRAKRTEPLHITIPGLQASCLLQTVVCDIMDAPSGQHHPDYFPMIFLSELLTRNEGPIFTAIRGRGYAYDAGVSLYLWNGQLVFEVHDASEPLLALLEWWKLLETWWGDGADEKWQLGNPACNFSQFDLDTTYSAIVYRLAAETSTPSGFMSQSLKATLRVSIDVVFTNSVSSP